MLIDVAVMYVMQVPVVQVIHVVAMGDHWVLCVVRSMHVSIMVFWRFTVRIGR